jgi:phage terminase Nu1 subunit (DNA packaging protein)
MPRKPEISGQRLNRGQMAAMLACSPVTLDRYVAAGCPVQSRGKTSQGHEFDSDAVMLWLRRRREVDAETGAGAQSEAKRRHQLAVAELKEFQLAEKRGSMIRVEDVAPIVADELANVRSRLLAMPGRLAATLVGLDQGAIEAKIRRGDRRLDGADG